MAGDADEHDALALLVGQLRERPHEVDRIVGQAVHGADQIGGCGPPPGLSPSPLELAGGDPVKLRVAPGTPSGRVLRVKGRGVENAKGTGDLLAEVQVAVPSHLDDAAREALERYHELEPKENPRADLMSRARG